MLKIYLHKAFRALVPRWLRERIHGLPVFAHVRRRFFESDTRMHDAYYDKKYYDYTQKWSVGAAPVIAGDLMRLFKPSSFLDVGCGAGDYLASVGELGIRASGIELAQAARDICTKRGLDVVAADLTKSTKLPREGDVVMSCEVAEHLPQSAAETFVAGLCNAAGRYVVLTAAAPGQDGQNHLNCQPKSYWIKLFQTHNFEYEVEVSSEWERQNSARGLPGWWVENLMVYRRRGTAVPVA